MARTNKKQRKKDARANEKKVQQQSLLDANSRRWLMILLLPPILVVALLVFIEWQFASALSSNTMFLIRSSLLSIPAIIACGAFYQALKSDNLTGDTKHRIHQMIFGVNTPEGRGFDIIILVLILQSVGLVMLESVEEYGNHPVWREYFHILEWLLTILFTFEYGLRLYSVKRKSAYAFSFYGMVDLLSIIPTYLTLFALNTQYLISIRSLRLLRVFRVFKLARYLGESQVLLDALKASRAKITVFLGAVLISVMVIGSVMYLVEGPADSGFTSIPKSVYWAIVTITTVGYGDISPVTPFGQFLAALLMIIGYGIIAVPTGIVSSEISTAMHEPDHIIPMTGAELDDRVCDTCGHEHHPVEAIYCNRCGEELDE